MNARLKLFVGARIRELRAREKETQGALAARLGVSASYMNQIERDQRPLTSDLMLKLCSLYTIAPGYFGDSEELRQVQMLREILGDPLFKRGGMAAAEIQAAIRAAPALADRFITLYRAFRESKPELHGAREEHSLPDRKALPAVTISPYDAVGDWVQLQRNYFDEIDRAAEELYETAGLGEGMLAANLTRYLRDRHGIGIATDHDFDGQGLVWRFDRRGRTLRVADGIPSESALFGMAQVVGQLDYGRLLDRALRRSGLVGHDARALARICVSNYFAGALLLPYGRFRRAAQAQRHDLDQLQRQFGVSFEQVCHRLTTLQRPGAEGIPFYFIKTDIAGNILKNFSGTRFALTNFGGLCSQWNVFRSFAAPGQLQVQLSRTTDDSVFINVARTVGRAGVSYFDRPRLMAVVLGCSVTHASEIVYSAGLDLEDERMIIPIGPGCRACIRTDCRHRALPAAGFHINAATDERGVLPYGITAE